MTHPETRQARPVAFVTGAARGQGREIAVALAQQGRDVAILDACSAIETVRYQAAGPADLEETRALVEAAGARCVAGIVDVRSLPELTEFAAKVVAEFGGIDAVCANAGIADWVPFTAMTAEQWQVMIDVNLTGVFNTAKATVGHLIDRGGGALVLTSSVNGREAGEGLTHYTAAKAGVLALTRNLALELGRHGIRANAVLPSAIDTEMANNPTIHEWMFGHPGATQDDYQHATKQWHVLRNRPALPPSVVAQAVCWLLSDQASNITGTELPVDGGHLILPGFNHRAHEFE